MILKKSNTNKLHNFVFILGFSNSSKLWLPLNSDYWLKNMADESKTKSNLKTFRQLSRLRKNPTFVKGDLHLYTMSEWVFGFSRYIFKSFEVKTNYILHYLYTIHVNFLDLFLRMYLLPILIKF